VIDDLIDNGPLTIVRPFSAAQRRLAARLGADQVSRDPLLVDSRGDVVAILCEIPKSRTTRVLRTVADWAPGSDVVGMFLTCTAHYVLRDPRGAALLQLARRGPSLELHDIDDASLGLVRNDSMAGGNQLCGGLYGAGPHPRLNRAETERRARFVQPVPLTPVDLVINTPDARPLARVLEVRERHLQLTLAAPSRDAVLLVGLLCALAMPDWPTIPSRASGG
jgi:hypothetical protein